MILLYLFVTVFFYIGFKVGSIVHKGFVVKLISAFSLFTLFCKFSFSIHFFIFAFFVITLIVASVVDYLHRIIPVMIPLVLCGFGISVSFFNSILGGTHVLHKFLNSVFGVFIGGGALFLIGSIGKFFIKKRFSVVVMLN